MAFLNQAQLCGQQTTAPVPESAFDSVIRRMEALDHQINEAIGHLTQRLNPAMRPSYPKPEAANKLTEVATSAPAIETLDRICNTRAANLAILQDMLDRLAF